MKKTMALTLTGPKRHEDRSAGLLHSRLCEIYEEMRRERRIEVLGQLDFEVVEGIDGKKHRIAKLKGNRILVHVRAFRLPKSALKYIIAHEIAHTLTKRHTRRFWKVVQSIYPKFEMGQNLLTKYRSRTQGGHGQSRDKERI